MHTNRKFFKLKANERFYFTLSWFGREIVYRQHVCFCSGLGLLLRSHGFAFLIGSIGCWEQNRQDLKGCLERRPCVGDEILDIR
jgi:hypothetical protein